MSPFTSETEQVGAWLAGVPVHADPIAPYVVFRNHVTQAMAFAKFHGRISTSVPVLSAEVELLNPLKG